MGTDSITHEGMVSDSNISMSCSIITECVRSEDYIISPIPSSPPYMMPINESVSVDIKMGFWLVCGGIVARIGDGILSNSEPSLWGESHEIGSLCVINICDG